MKIPIQFFASVVFVLIASHMVSACTCVGSTPCQRSSYAQTGFVGKVVEFTTTTRRMGSNGQLLKPGEKQDGDFEVQRQVSRLAVEEAFFGTGGQTEIVVETDISSSCSFPLKTGESYLIYGGRYDNEANLTTSYCSGSKIIDRSKPDDDLEYLRHNKGGAVISGKVAFQIGNEPRKLGRFGVNTVRLTSGDKQFDAPIGDDGSYAFPEAAPGTYKLQVVLPEFLTSKSYDHGFGRGSSGGAIEVGQRGCFMRDFVVRDNGRVSGQMVDEKGQLIKNITVHLIPTDPDWRKLAESLACHDLGLCVYSEDGRFNFFGLKEGKYLLSVRMGEYICSNCADAAYMKTFYPDVPDEKNAALLAVSFGSLTENISFKLSRKYREREIRGRVLFADGGPAPNVRVRYSVRTPDMKSNAITFLKTDEAGNFSFIGYDGHHYLIGAFTDERDNNKPLQSFAKVVAMKPGGKMSEVSLVLDQQGNKLCSGCGDYSGFPKSEKPDITKDR